MFAIGIVVLALFSVISIVLGHEEPRSGSTPRDDLALWMRLGIR